MNEQLHIDSDALIDEIARYLAAVDTFRAANCEPTWRPEVTTPGADGGPTRGDVPIEMSAH